MAWSMIDGRTPSTRTELGEQLGRRGRVVGDVVDAAAALRAAPRRRRRGAGPAPAWSASGRRPRAPRRCGTATTRPSTSSKPSAASSSRSPATELLAHLLGEALERPDRAPVPSTAALSMIARCGGGSWSSAGGDQGAQRTGKLGAAAAVGGQPRRARRGTAGCRRRARRARRPRRRHVAVARSRMPARAHTASSRRSGPSGTLHDQRAVDGRRPHQIRVGPLRRDEQERQVGERAHDDRQQVAQQRVGPLQVVDPQHGHPRPGVRAAACRSTRAATASRAPAASRRSSGDG